MSEAPVNSSTNAGGDCIQEKETAEANCPQKHSEASAQPLPYQIDQLAGGDNPQLEKVSNFILARNTITIQNHVK